LSVVVKEPNLAKYLLQRLAKPLILPHNRASLRGSPLGSLFDPWLQSLGDNEETKHRQ